MLSKRLIILFGLGLLFSIEGWSQCKKLALNPVTGKMDCVSGITIATTAPSTCIVGDLFFDSDATAGENWYGCTSANTWTLQTNAGVATAMTQAVENSADNTVSVSVGTSGRAFEKTGVTINPSTGATGLPGALTITGSADAVQNKTICNATQSTNPQGIALYASDGTTLLFAANCNGTVEWGSGTTPWNLTSYTDDALPSAPGTANQFTAAVDRSSGLFTWIINGGATQYSASGTSAGAAALGVAEAYDATNWDLDTATPTKNDVRDKFEALAPSGVVADAARNAKDKTHEFSCTFDGGGSTVIDNSICYKRLRVGGTITGWSVVAVGSSPACTADVLKIAAGTALPTASIAGSALPALTSTDNAVVSTTLTGWTTSIAVDDIAAIKITEPGAATWVEVVVYYTES